MTKTRISFIDLIALKALKHSLKNGGKSSEEFVSSIFDKVNIDKEISKYGEPNDIGELEELNIMRNYSGILEQRVSIYSFSFGFECDDAHELYELLKENGVFDDAE